MTEDPGQGLSALSDPALVALLCGVDPFGLGGIAVRARAGPLRDRWLARLRGCLAPDAPFRRLPIHADEARVFGGLDLAATLAAGRPIAEQGVLADTDGGMLQLSMAERLPDAMAARIGAVLDQGIVVLERDGLASRRPARIGIVALDEGIGAEERMPASLLERLAFWIDLDGFDPGQPLDGPTVTEARRRYPAVLADDAVLTALAETALALGVGSMRASVLALRAARAAAALAGRTSVAEQDAALAARLILAPRATRLPVDDKAEPPPADDPPPDSPPDDREPESDPEQEGEANRTSEALGDIVLAAAKAAIPAGLLDRLQAEAAARSARQTPGRAGALQASTKRGRPAGLRHGTPGGGARLNVIETLRAAAPWQRLRARPGDAPLAPPDRRLEIRRDDLRITRFKQRSETTTIFVVDASGSLAASRLAEAKGAVELLLADCYVRRDQVALLAFRGQGAELLLPPTRSLARAKRCLAELPGGGATPLASAIDAALAVAETIRRRGQTPVVVFLTDGRANVARDGTTGREKAEEDALAAARAAGASGIRMLVVDAAQRPQPSARALAAAMSGLYLPLPRAEATTLSRAVRSVTAA